jgi:hypothetical protein
MYLVYHIQSLSDNNNRPYTIGFYFNGQNNYGNWNTTVWAVDENSTVNGSIKLSAATLLPLNSTDNQLHNYLEGYKDSVAWIAAAANSEAAASLSAKYWYLQNCQEACTINVYGTENVSVPAGNFITTPVGWDRVYPNFHANNRIWIDKDLPFPVKGTVYYDTLAPNPPYLFNFQLLSYGRDNTPPIPTPEFPDGIFMTFTFIGAIAIILVAMKQQVKLR